MRSKWVPLALVCAAWGVGGVFAQPAPGLSSPPEGRAAQAAAPRVLGLAEAVRLVLEHNPSLAASRREVEAAQGALTQAGAYQNPSLGVEVEDLRSGRRTTTMSWSQPLELGGQRAARMAAAERALDAARVQRDAREAQLGTEVTAAFLAALLSQERVRLAQASLDVARSGSQAAAKRVQAGKVSPLEETRSRLAEANVHLEWTQAQGDWSARLQELRALVAGGPPFDALEGDALTLPSLPAIEALQIRVADAPALRQARLETLRLAALADLEQAKRTPDLTLSVGVQRAQQDGRTQAIVGVSIPLPVFDTNRGNIVEALRRRDKSEDEARALELRLRADLSIARERVARASQEVAAVRADILPAAQLAFDAATRGFELGKFEYLDVLDAQRTLLQARTQYLRSLGEAHQAAADVARLLGGTVFQP